MTIVLMHGFGAFMHLLADTSIRPMVAELRSNGHDVVAPMVQPYDTVPERAKRWMEELRGIRNRSGSALHLIGFSSGGLDARYLVSHLGAAEFVASIDTISTPHRGSSFADFILEKPRPIQTGLTKIADWMGDRFDSRADSKARLALEQLTIGYVTEVFNPETPDHPDVAYRSWAGRAGMGTQVPITPVLRISNRIIFEREGENDGLVSIESARWSGFQGTIDADHARQIGVNAMNGRFDAASFVSGLAESAAMARQQAG